MNNKTLKIFKIIIIISINKHNLIKIHCRQVIEKIFSKIFPHKTNNNNNLIYNKIIKILIVIIIITAIVVIYNKKHNFTINLKSSSWIQITKT